MAKTTKKYNLPNIDPTGLSGGIILPFGGSPVQEQGLSFSFASFDRSHKLFNLGSESAGDPVEASWFLDLLQCLKDISGRTQPELIQSIYQLHPVDWNKANTSPPAGSEQAEYWQFRINKSRGRVIGIILMGIFYVVWLDPHHNLTDSEGYGGATKYKYPLSDYEKLMQENQRLLTQNVKLQKENQAFEDLFNEQAEASLSR